MNRRVLKRIRNEAGQALLLVIALLGMEIARIVRTYEQLRLSGKVPP